MASYELLALNEATPQAVAPTASDTGVVTNLSVTTNATVGGTLGVTGAITNSAGTAKGVPYLNASKVLTSGTALVFDGTYFRIGAGTGGIQFSGDTAAANALDDYEEGTWTPTATFDVPGTLATSNQVGTYTKIGNVVSVMGRISITKGTATGNLALAGLPFTSINTTNYQAAGALSTDRFGVALKTYQILLANNTTAPIALAVTQATGQSDPVTADDFYATVGAIRFSFVYRTA